MPKFTHIVRNHEYYGTLYRDLPDCKDYLIPETLECYNNFIQDIYQSLIKRKENLDSNGEYFVAIATMRLVAKYAIRGNYSDDVVYQIQQLIYSDIYLQAAYYNTFKSLPLNQKVVLVSIPNLGYNNNELR